MSNYPPEVDTSFLDRDAELTCDECGAELRPNEVVEVDGRTLGKSCAGQVCDCDLDDPCGCHFEAGYTNRADDGEPPLTLAECCARDFAISVEAHKR